MEPLRPLATAHQPVVAPESTVPRLTPPESSPAPTVRKPPTPKPLTLDRIFRSAEFSGESFPAYQWCERRGGYTTLEKPADDGGLGAYGSWNVGNWCADVQARYGRSDI